MLTFYVHLKMLHNFLLLLTFQSELFVAFFVSGSVFMIVLIGNIFTFLSKVAGKGNLILNNKF